ncbi:GGDEF domain-containing protein [Terasakiella sp. A23]|uniref:GGDEF domain-containing protein n=1 Tax=Terasakiella sp. FCG-A23 TaxID=3080561 RepID=UPI00295421E5|nr:GGDEF domain-containing protein [Terasakiella sp. A23]MDV7339689.1 GGDEF domain-containing protein [Terasakiella sp. A23]
MAKLREIKALEDQCRTDNAGFKADLFIVGFANLAVLLIASQVDLTEWLQGVAFTGAGIFIPLSISLSLSLVYLSERKRREAAAQRDRFMLESKHDNLTGLYNRQFLQDSANIELARTKRVPSTFSVILLDIDHFKKINDTQGHDIGDAVLKTFSHVLENVVRQIDVVARWGGEEFIIMCRDTNDQGAYTLATKIQKGLKEATFACNHPVTASMGVASVDEAENLEDLIKIADTRMYEAKNQGRNRIVNRTHKTQLA